MWHGHPIHVSDAQRSVDTSLLVPHVLRPHVADFCLGWVQLASGYRSHAGPVVPLKLAQDLLYAVAAHGGDLVAQTAPAFLGYDAVWPASALLRQAAAAEEPLQAEDQEKCGRRMHWLES